MTLVVFLAALIGGMLIGLPICFALLFSGVCMMLYLNGFNAQILSQNLFSGADSFSMMAVPFLSWRVNLCTVAVLQSVL